MIYLDTHIVVWLYAGLKEKLSDLAQTLINNHDIYISPIVRLELQYLWEIERLTEKPDAIIADLSHRIGLKICDRPYNLIITQALEISWTREPFDRIITANASLNNNILVTKDEKILAHYECAQW